MLRGAHDGLCGGDGCECIAEAVDCAAFYIDAAQVCGCAEGRRIVEEFSGLRGVSDVAAKENDAGRAHELEPCTLQAGELCAGKADDQQAAGSMTHGS
jgi:hypothetical protein